MTIVVNRLRLLEVGPEGAPARPKSGTASRISVSCLFLFWVVVTACNLFKPYHIDDAAHLFIAQWIASHPLHSMSGLLNWSGIEEPIARTNQPHLYFYLLAGWGSLFGFSEPAMHALQALFAGAVIVLFHTIAREVAAPNALWLTALLVLGPAFAVEQNLMVDVPLLALWLLFFAALLCSRERDRHTRRFVVAGLACAAAILVKYSSLVLLPILGASILLERRWRQAWTLFIPLAAIIGWSLFNLWDYGGIHMLARPRSAQASPVRVAEFAGAWVVALGALTPLGCVVAGRAWPKRERAFYLGVGVAGLCLVFGVLCGLPDTWSDALLWVAFAANGALVGAGLLPSFRAIAHLEVSRPETLRAHAVPILLCLWIGGTSAFYILFAPFIASRHLLLILPPVLLLLGRRWGATLSGSAKAFCLMLTIAVSAGLCVSDWRFAAFYRDEAADLARNAPPGQTIWVSGHWGWQWYAAKNGLPEVDVRSTVLQPGSLLAVAEDVDHQTIQPPPRLRLVRTDQQTDLPLNLFCTGRTVRFYSSDLWHAPWSLSRTCSNRVDLFAVE